MPRYHNNTNGPAICHAKPGNCPITKETDEQHYLSIEKAQSAYEAKLASIYVDKSTVTANKNLRPIKIDRHDSLPSFYYELNENYKAVVDSLVNGEVPEVLLPDNDNFINSIRLHGFFQDVGYYGRVTKDFVGNLKAYISDSGCSNPVVLDPMAGKGFFVKALRESGVKTIASDDKSWAAQSSDRSILDLDAIDSLRKHGGKVTHLVMSWPPYAVDIDYRLYKVIREEFPHIKIIYIGESNGGCTGSDDFHSAVFEDEGVSVDYPDVGYVTTTGINDSVFVVSFNQ